jgi:hypothetical protein
MLGQERAMKSISMTMVGAVSLAVLGGIALAAQDKYTVKVPGGLAFSEFRGYEGWQVVATKAGPDRFESMGFPRGYG